MRPKRSLLISMRYGSDSGKIACCRKERCGSGLSTAQPKDYFLNCLIFSSGVFLKQIFILQKINLTNLSPTHFRVAGCGFVRPPEHIDAMLTTRFIANETCVLAVPTNHRLVSYDEVSIDDFRHEPVILPERRTRRHSHDLTMNIFKEGAACLSSRSMLKRSRLS